MTHVLGLLLSACLAHGPLTQESAADKIAAAGQLPLLADLRQIEVRVRKLHMVRPDLLQYPLPYDVIC